MEHHPLWRTYYADENQPDKHMSTVLIQYNDLKHTHICIPNLTAARDIVKIEAKKFDTFF